MLDVFLEFVQGENHSILLSSHITSGLEKIADYIMFIHNGKGIMTVSRNDLIYNYAVMRCKESQFHALDSGDIIAYRKRDFQIVYVMIGIVGFSVNAAAVVKNEFISKWGKYKLTMAALGISISLFMGAMFFPFFYLGGAERSNVFLGIALLCASGIDLMIVTVMNELLDRDYPRSCSGQVCWCSVRCWLLMSLIC